MADPQDPQRGPHQNEIPRDRYDDAEAQLGGADAVEKTTYVTGSGTSPEAQSKDGVPSARVGSGSRGFGNVAMWIAIALMLMIVARYLFGIGRG